MLKLKSLDVMFVGSSGLNKQRNSDQTGAIPPSYLLLKSMGTKYEDIRNDIKLSTTSLNSTCSGSSSNSSESNTNKNVTTVSSSTSGGEQWGGGGEKPWLNNSENSLNVVTSPPSESTSELSSVLSSNTLIVSPVVNNIPLIINNNNNNKKGSSMLQNLSVRPSSSSSSSTGAIPKSISFDTSADKGYRDFDDDASRCSKRGSFFGKLKMGFRNRRGKSREDYNSVRFDCADADEVISTRKTDHSKIVASNAGIICYW